MLRFVRVRWGLLSWGEVRSGMAVEVWLMSWGGVRRGTVWYGGAGLVILGVAETTTLFR